MNRSALHTTVAETLVHCERDLVFVAIVKLVDRLWPASTEVVVAGARGCLLHSITNEPGSDEIAAWVTWELGADAPAGWTRVRLVHDQADTCAGPAPDLDVLLAVLVKSAENVPEQ